MRPPLVRRMESGVPTQALHTVRKSRFIGSKNLNKQNDRVVKGLVK